MPLFRPSAPHPRPNAIASWLLIVAAFVFLMVVIGGYNSSNTYNLARICAEKLPTYHIAEPAGIVSERDIRHKPVGSKSEITTSGWLPARGPLRIGLTSGASTPDNLVGAVIRRLDELANGLSTEARSAKVDG